MNLEGLNKLVGEVIKNTDKPMDGLLLLKQNAPSPLDAYLYEPVLCLILPGRKQVAIGEQTLSFGQGQCLLVSHDLHVVMSASDRVLCLNGHICCQGSPQVVQNAPEYRALFGPGTGGTMALYRHEHDHEHDHDHDHSHEHA